MEYRVTSGVLTAAIRDLYLELRKSMEIWLLVNNTEEREMVLNLLGDCPVTLSVFTVADVSNEVSKSGMY